MKTIVEYLNENIINIIPEYILDFIGGDKCVTDQVSSKDAFEEIKNDIDNNKLSLLKYCKNHCIEYGTFRCYDFNPVWTGGDGWGGIFKDMDYSHIDTNKIQNNMTSMYYDGDGTVYYMVWDKSLKEDKLKLFVKYFFNDYLDDFLTYFPGQKYADKKSRMW